MNEEDKINLLKNLLLEYAEFKQSSNYDEQYKWDYANEHQNKFNNFDDFENKIASLGNENFKSYFLRQTGLKHLMSPYNIDTFKENLKLLLDDSIDLEQRINEFSNNLKNLLNNDKNWNNKKLIPDETDASYFLFTNNYEKYLLFNPKTAFNDFFKKLELSEFLDKSDRIKRYVKIQDYCKNTLIPIMNEILNNNNTLLDAQDFIRFVSISNSNKNKIVLIGATISEDKEGEEWLSKNDAWASWWSYPIKQEHINTLKNNLPIKMYIYQKGKIKKYFEIIDFVTQSGNDGILCPEKWNKYLSNQELIGKTTDPSNNSLSGIFKTWFLVKNITYLDTELQLENFIPINGELSPQSMRNGFGYVKDTTIEREKIMPLNQILYGPPGTGKTYNTIVKAMEIIEPELFEKNENGNISNYSALQTKFNEYKEKGQIEFVTFHQSYSYEEFVEGIKPDLKNETDLKYKLENGTFKTICKNATSKETDNFDEAYAKLVDIIQDYCEENSLPYFDKLKTKSNRTFAIAVNQNGNLNLHTGKDLNQQGSLIKQKLHDLSDWKSYAQPILEYMKQNCGYTTTKKNENEKYVLIIDEINRGNISKIFGELITLIEEDKRENLTVTLPYSQEQFTVPKNLYIIGTMNTSDRSIASVDIALRRRFRFVEMMPNKDLVADFGVDFKNKFEKLNKRISVLLDRDHQIGHSYFINTKYNDEKGNNNPETLREIWFNEIMPLLNEYFYGDWEKLQALLGKAKSEKENTSFIVKIEDVDFNNNYTCDEDEKFDFAKIVNNSDFYEALKYAFGEKNDKFIQKENTDKQ